VDAVGFAPGSAAELAGRIAGLVADPGARARLGTAARATASAKFSPARMAAEFREVYAG
jgi:glycosyltransferase involved in cell wall biosynthesis